MKPTPDAADRGNRTLSAARKQLGRAIGDALSGPLEALTERLRGAGQTADASQAAARSKYRLREVLDSDRSSRSEDDAFAQSSSGSVNAPASIAEVPNVSLAAASAFGTYSRSHAEPMRPQANVAELHAASEPATSELPALGAGPPPHLEAAPPASAASAEIAPSQATPEASTQTRSKPPASPEAAANASVLDEPIRTRSMAKLLAGQGHAKRALAIYDFLLLKSPDDVSLRADADAVRAQLSA